MVPANGPVLPMIDQVRLMTGQDHPMTGQGHPMPGQVRLTTAFDYRFGAGKSGNS